MRPAQGVITRAQIVAQRGDNSYGQIGTGTTSNSGPVTTPTAIADVPMPIEVAAYTQTSCAVDATGDAYCWGINYKGGLGDGTFDDRWSPTRVLGLPGRARTVEPAYGASYALLEDGTVWAWGSSLDGQLGDGTTIDRPTPGPVPGLSSIVDVVSENRLTCATDGTALWCWGRTLAPTPALQPLECPEES
ncbi:MAG: RCC1 domain-containing protein [Kofleriaceae bacterium]